MAAEVGAGHQLHDQEHLIAALDHIEDGHDVGVRQLGEGAAFAANALAQRRRAGGRQLHGHGPAQLGIARGPDHAHAAAAGRRDQLVATHGHRLGAAEQRGPGLGPRDLLGQRIDRAFARGDQRGGGGVGIGGRHGRWSLARLATGCGAVRRGNARWEGHFQPPGRARPLDGARDQKSRRILRRSRPDGPPRFRSITSQNRSYVNTGLTTVWTLGRLLALPAS
ncbi:MAG: hypothetical protein JNK64_28195 [Myxococcales bacterium]|nr:hypothetical protein [Myxococcales bacterium]